MLEIVEYRGLGTVRVLTRPPFAPPERDQDLADRLMLHSTVSRQNGLTRKLISRQRAIGGLASRAIAKRPPDP